MTLRPIDRIIGREVGLLVWNMLPDAFPGIAIDETTFRTVWDTRLPPELAALQDEDPLVDYPVIYLGLDVMAGLVERPFVYASNFGSPIRLSEYLGALRRFLILQLTGTENRHAELIMRAVQTVYAESSPEEALRFVDELWRGRWIIGAADWSHLRRSIITGGSEEGIDKLHRDGLRLEEEAVRLIQTERMVKDAVVSMDEWLHECYCMLPDVFTWALTMSWANDSLQSEDLAKFIRILDEFQADIGTTIGIPIYSLKGGETLADNYALKPLNEAETVEDAVSTIRGIYRGRTIIPRIWYERAADAISRIPDHNWDRPTNVTRLDKGAALLSAEDWVALNDVDPTLAFGWFMTLDGRQDSLLNVGMLFDYYPDNQI